MLSVIIPTSGPWYLPRLHNCLRSINAQRFVDPCEILVTYMYKFGEKPSFGWTRNLGVDVIPCEYNAEDWVPSLARNVGFRRASGDVLMSVDADSFLHPDTFRVCYEIAQTKFVTVRTKMLPYPAVHDMFQKAPTAELFKKHKDEEHFGQGPGCVIAAPKSAVYAIGGWDERFVGYGAADHDFVERLRQHDIEQVDLPTGSCDIYVIHQYHDAGAQKSQQNVAGAEFAILQENSGAMESAAKQSAVGGKTTEVRSCLEELSRRGPSYSICCLSGEG